MCVLVGSVVLSTQQICFHERVGVSVFMLVKRKIQAGKERGLYSLSLQFACIKRGVYDTVGPRPNSYVQI